MRHHIRFPTVVAALGISVSAAADCGHSEPRSADVDAGGAAKIVIEARAGDLKVHGTTTTHVRVTGAACAPTKDALDDIKIEARRSGAAVIVKAILPENQWLFESASLDLNIEVPASIAVEIVDSSGDVEIRHIGALKLEDSSGDATLRDLGGDVSVTDSSGDVRIETVRGNVSVTDSSGDVAVEDVVGNVAIPIDSSGGLSIRRVRGGVHVTNDSSGDISIGAVDKDVVVDNDSSGDIRVADVGGAFIVSNDTTGVVEHYNVLGTVRVPQRR